jgi:integrase
MARPNEGWKLRPKDGVYYVRFTAPNGARIERSTGCGDAREAAAVAADIYARFLVAGDVAPRAVVDPTASLEDLIARWLVAMQSTHDPETVSTYAGYGRRFLTFFGDSLTGITRARMGDYQRERLTKILRDSVLKERSAMNTFLAWCEEQGVLAEEMLPEWPKLPDRATGVRSGPQRAAPVDVTPEQVRDFLLALPVWSLRTRKGKPFPVRARFVFAYETGLRPATLDELEVPTHWKPGAVVLRITDKIDKSRYGRTLPLSALAIAALEATVAACGIREGLIFGRHDYRTTVERARQAAGLPEDFAPYDLRHGRSGHLLDETGDMRAVAFLVGHRRLTTTDRYLRGQEDRARAALSAPGSGGIVGEGDVMLSAKDPNRTGTGVTPLEPESSGERPGSDIYETKESQEGPRNTPDTPGSGACPETLSTAARYLAVLRADADVLDAMVASELLGGES